METILLIFNKHCRSEVYLASLIAIIQAEHSDSVLHFSS